MGAFGEVCGAAPARSHARSGDRNALAAGPGHGDVFDRAAGTSARWYAGQGERDHRTLVDAVAAGRLPVAGADARWRVLDSSRLSSGYITDRTSHRGITVWIPAGQPVPGRDPTLRRP